MSIGDFMVHHDGVCSVKESRQRQCGLLLSLLLSGRSTWKQVEALPGISHLCHRCRMRLGCTSYNLLPNQYIYMCIYVYIYIDIAPQYLIEPPFREAHCCWGPCWRAS